MDSATSKKMSEQERQTELRRQIALLQAQLNDGATSEDLVDSAPSRKRPTSGVLVPETPSKKKKLAGGGKKVPAPATATSTKHRVSTAPSKGPISLPLQRPSSALSLAPSSTVLQKLAQAHNQKGKTTLPDTVARSQSFTAKPPPIATSSNLDVGAQNARDDDLALVEELPLGPLDHKPPFDDPYFEKLEPNSGIRLSSRAIPHEDFQDHLRGRYYLSPSKLYSVIRLLPNKQGYDVPVCGDWLTIAVVAERGQMKYTKASVGISHEDKFHQEPDEDRMDVLPSLDGPAQAQPGPLRPFQKRQRPQDAEAKPGGKKYVNMKLIDFGCRSRGSSADGGKAKIRGDAYLTLLLFESDMCDVVTKEDGSKQKIYRGGSRGAFERMSKLREGAVVALLNPKILKPFQRSADKPHPTENILALTPESDASIAVIGYAQDLGMCRATKRDGTRCTSWCDKRVSDVCDYHIQYAVERRRAARPEFTAGTSGMGTSAKKKPAYDPARQWGLKPETQSSGATYVVSGLVVSSSASDHRTMFIGENIGREAQAKAARKLAADSDKALKQLLSRDKEGTKVLMSAREFSERRTEAVKEEDKKKGKSKKGAGAEKRIAKAAAAPAADVDRQPKKSAYSAELIKQLGFDPTSKDGRVQKDASIQKKLDALAALQATRKIELGPRLGKKSSCVRQPVQTIPTEQSRSQSPATHADLEHTDEDVPGSPLLFPDSDNELEKDEVPAFGKQMGGAMIDLDDSDSES